MKRRSVKVIKSRLEDIEVGDVVNRFPDAELGWFTVDEISTLHNGNIQLADVTVQLTVSGLNEDLVGVQLIEEIQLDEHGVVAASAPAPAVMAAPIMPAPQTGMPAQQAVGAMPAASQAATAPDREAEAAVAAKIATQMSVPSVAGLHVPPAVDLALVAELLEDLDFGDAPTIAGAPGPFEAPQPVPSSDPQFPEGTISVDGGELPTTPSYKNPVVMPGGSLLSRRVRAG